MTDRARREFLKKLAQGAVYAAPVIRTVAAPLEVAAQGHGPGPSHKGGGHGHGHFGGAPVEPPGLGGAPPGAGGGPGDIPPP
jgi:hypothetical protein